MRFDIILPKHVKDIIERIEAAGFEAYAVGGCVRDAILGHEPADWDITTSAKPEQVKSLFQRTVDTGLQHGTVTVLMEDEGYEVTTYRIDGEYTDHRRPDQVAYTNNLLEDLKRRDFTINAMAYNGHGEVVDAFGGLTDLESGIIRCVGVADERFHEDALRMLRAIRFAARFGYDIERKTIEAIRHHSDSIINVSAERIQVELTKTLISKHPEYIYKLHEYGLMKHIMPEFEAIIGVTQNNPYHVYTVDQHTLKALMSVENTKVLRWAMLLHDFGKADTKTVDEAGVEHFYNHGVISAKKAKAIFNRLKFDNDTRDRVVHLIQYHDYFIEPNIRTVRRMMRKIGTAYFMDYIAMRRADVLSQRPEWIEDRLATVDEVVACYDEVIQKAQCVKISDLNITGKDIIALGLKTGPNIGIVLSKLLDAVVETPELNTYEQLKTLAEAMVDEINDLQ